VDGGKRIGIAANDVDFVWLIKLSKNERELLAFLACFLALLA